MQTSSTPFEHVRGTTLEIHGWVKSTSSTRTDKAKNIAGDTLNFAIAERISSVVMQTIVGNSGATITKVDSAAGYYTISVPGSTTDNTGASPTLPKEDYHIQVNLVDGSNGKEYVVLRGPLKLIAAPAI